MQTNIKTYNLLFVCMIQVVNISDYISIHFRIIIRYDLQYQIDVCYAVIHDVV